MFTSLMSSGLPLRWRTVKLPELPSRKRAAAKPLARPLPAAHTANDPESCQLPALESGPTRWAEHDGVAGGDGPNEDDRLAVQLGLDHRSGRHRN